MTTDDYILQAIINVEKNNFLYWRKQLGTSVFVAEILNIVEGESLGQPIWEITYNKYNTDKFGGCIISEPEETGVSIPKPDIEIDKSFIGKRYNVNASLSFTYRIEGRK